MNELNNFDVIVTSPKGYEPDVRIHFTANSDVMKSTVSVQGPTLGLLAGVTQIIRGLVVRGMPKILLETAIKLGFEMAEREADENE